MATVPLIFVELNNMSNKKILKLIKQAEKCKTAGSCTTEKGNKTLWKVWAPLRKKNPKLTIEMLASEISEQNTSGALCEGKKGFRNVEKGIFYSVDFETDEDGSATCEAPPASNPQVPTETQARPI